MSSGIGDLFTGLGSIGSALIQSGNQRQANNIAQQNALMQFLLGQQNNQTQERLGNRNIDLQQDMFNRNFNLQQDTARRNYSIADNAGSLVQALLESTGQNALGYKRTGLDTQQAGLNTQQNALQQYFANLADAGQVGQQGIDLAKTDKSDAYSNQVYYDPATRSFKVKPSASQQQILDANDTENILRSTVDQQRARRGNVQNEAIRGRAMDMFKQDADEYQFGQPAVNEGDLANKIRAGQDANRQSGYAALRSALATQAIRGGNSASIADIGQQVRSDPNSFFSDSANADMQAAEFAQQQNQAKRQAALQGLTTTGGLATFTGDANNAMGQNSGLDQMNAIAAQSPDALAAALQNAYGLKSGARSQLAEAQDRFGNSQKQFGLAQAGYGDDLNNYAGSVSGAMNSKANALISALSNGAGAQGNALQNGASAQGNAISNLASALASAYGAQASGIGSALTNQAKLLNSQKIDLSGFGKVAGSLGNLFAGQFGGSGGTTSVPHTGGRTF